MAVAHNIGNNGASTLAGQITEPYSLAFAQGQKGNGAGQNFMVADPLLSRSVAPDQHRTDEVRNDVGEPVGGPEEIADDRCGIHEELELDAGTEFDHAIGGDPEKCSGA
jgi:hypothetical protein